MYIYICILEVLQCCTHTVMHSYHYTYNYTITTLPLWNIHHLWHRIQALTDIKLIHYYHGSCNNKIINYIVTTVYYFMQITSTLMPFLHMQEICDTLFASSLQCSGFLHSDTFKVNFVMACNITQLPNCWQTFTICPL